MPLQHIVLFELDSSVDPNGESAKRMQEGLLSLDSLPCVTKTQCGPLFLKPGMKSRAKGFQIGFVATIDENDNLPVYSKSKEHVKVVNELILPVLAKDGILAFDFEVPESTTSFSPLAVAGAVLGGIVIGYALGTGKCCPFFSCCK
eukprot:m.785703 g.785703  ORF g.785703 m.785703 type:complete len:146 (+) comp23303_c0_seq1:143-580(+)